MFWYPAISMYCTVVVVFTVVFLRTLNHYNDDYVAGGYSDDEDNDNCGEIEDYYDAGDNDDNDNVGEQ